MPDPLAYLWDRADAPEPVYSSDEMRRWPAGTRDMLHAAGLIRRIENAREVVCDACDEAHSEEVVLLESPSGSGARAYISCPVHGRVSVPLERLERWDIEFQTLSAATAAALSLEGHVQEIVPNRLWMLGRAAFGGCSRDVLFARGLTWSDAKGVAGEAARQRGATTTVVLVPGGMPSDDIWHGDMLPTISIKTLAHFVGNRLTLDRNLLAQSLPAIDEENVFRREGATWRLIYGRVAVSVLDSKGMAYIAELLKNPGQDIHAIMLRAAVEGTLPSARRGGEDEEQAESFPASGASVHVNALSDQQAIDQYRVRLAELEARIREAESNNDTGQAEALKREYHALTQEVARSVGLGGKLRSGGDAERARKAISNAIYRAYDEIKKQHPSLEQYLRQYINVAEVLSYRPDKPINWAM